MLTYEDVMQHSATLEKECGVNRKDRGIQIAELVGRFAHTFGEDNKYSKPTQS